LSENPVATIGGYEAGLASALGDVRGGLLLPDGQIALADGMSREIRLFSGEGEHRRTIGRRGKGPGEFGALSGISHDPAGGVCAWDGTLGRLTCFGPDGGIRNTVEPDLSSLPQFRPKFIGVFDDGSFVLEDSPPTMKLRGEPTGERRDTLRYLRFTSSGTPAGVLASLAGSETFFTNEDGMWGSRDILFGRGSFTHLDGARLALGTNDSLDLRVIDSAGTQLGRIAAPTALQAVDQGWVAGVRADLLRELEVNESKRTFSVRAEVFERLARFEREQIRGVPSRSTLPAFSGLRIDHAGLLWIGPPDHPGGEGRPWSILRADGTLVGRLELPADARILDIANGDILLLRQDDLDVESVLLYHVVGYPPPPGRRPAHGASEEDVVSAMLGDR
jgi:hypothetical protein